MKIRELLNKIQDYYGKYPSRTMAQEVALWISNCGIDIDALWKALTEMPAETDQEFKDGLEENIKEMKSFDDLEGLILANKKRICEIQGKEKKAEAKDESLAEQLVMKMSERSAELQALKNQNEYGRFKEL